MTKVEVSIYGQHLVVQGDGDEAYVHKLANYVEAQMQVLAQGMKTGTPAKLAILAALNIADQLFQQERRREAGEIEVDRRALDMMEHIEEQLSPSVSNRWA